MMEKGQTGNKSIKKKREERGKMNETVRHACNAEG